MDTLGIASVAAITIICYMIGVVFKAIPAIKDNIIPIVMGAAGAALGIAGFYLMPDFPANDIVNAVAIGIVSGLSATGINQIYRQATKWNEGE